MCVDLSATAGTNRLALACPGHKIYSSSRQVLRSFLHSWSSWRPSRLGRPGQSSSACYMRALHIFKVVLDRLLCDHTHTWARQLTVRKRPMFCIDLRPKRLFDDSFFGFRVNSWWNLECCQWISEISIVSLAFRNCWFQWRLGDHENVWKCTRAPFIMCMDTTWYLDKTGLFQSQETIFSWSQNISRILSNWILTCWTLFVDLLLQFR